MMKVCVIIPAYNESTAIREVIREVRRQNLAAVVVDDGSKDATARFSQDCGATVLRNSRNMGKGLSLIRGLKYVSDNDFDAAITMDGDGQHSPADIPRLIQKAESSGAGIVIGNRMGNPRRMPIIRILTNKFMSWLISRLIKQPVPDTQCGFRLIKKDLLKSLKFTTQRFETESEILFQASKLGFRIECVPIKTIYQDQKSSINPLIDTVRFINFIRHQLWIIR